jgi:hypothetical protein
MPVLNTAQLIRWSCPVNLGASPPGPDPDNSRTLMHVVDAAGNDFKIRCIKGFASFHYEYSVSFPNGTSKEISTCIYDLGFNDAEVVYSGPMSETTSPSGTPVINVGALLVVEHSNEEGQGLAGSAKPKPGGADFHMVYDFTHKFRYRLNTIIGKGATSTDLFASSAVGPPHSILHAEATHLRAPADYDSAIAGDTAFRRLDYPSAQPPPEEFKFQDADTDSVPIGYVYLGERERSGGILLDSTLRGSSFVLVPSGVEGSVPAIAARERSTFAIARSLFRGKADNPTISVDGRRVKATIRATPSMIAFDFPLNEQRHRLLIQATPGKAQARPKAKSAARVAGGRSSTTKRSRAKKAVATRRSKR